MNDIPLHLETLQCSDYLHRETFLVYNRNYTGMYSNDPEHPMFLNYIKNDKCSFDQNTLMDAEAELERHLKATFNNLLDNLLKGTGIFRRLRGEKNVLVCMVPRAKKLECYYPEQLGFAKVLRNLLKTYPLSFESGIDMIKRIHHTKTSHARNFSPKFTKDHMSILKEGLVPISPGFTKESCSISPEVQGRVIILVDDIYTPSVNIDEDAIQALYDNGASSVILYTVAKTIRTIHQEVQIAILD